MAFGLVLACLHACLSEQGVSEDAALVVVLVASSNNTLCTTNTLPDSTMAQACECWEASLDTRRCCCGELERIIMEFCLENVRISTYLTQH